MAPGDLAAQAGLTEGGRAQWVGKGASVVEGGRLWAGPLFRCPCRWRGCDSGRGRRPRWGRSCSPQGRWARRLRAAAAAARGRTGPRPEPRSLCGAQGGAQGPAGELRGCGFSPFPSSQTPPPLPSVLSVTPALSPLPFQAGREGLGRRCPGPCISSGPGAAWGSHYPALCRGAECGAQGMWG